MEITRYQDAAIDSRILRAVEEMGFVQMTPIQEQAIPVLLERCNWPGTDRNRKDSGLRNPCYTEYRSG